MARKYFLDKRFLVNGKNSKIDMDNALELAPYIEEVISEYDLNTVIQTYLTNNPTVKTVELVSADTELTIDNEYVSVTGNNITITLPAAVDVVGREFIIQAVDITGTLTIDTRSGHINGDTTVILTAKYDFIRVMSTGSKYVLLGSTITP